MTEVTLDSKIFNTSALRRELGKVPLEMAEETIEEQNKDMREEKSGVKYKRLPNRSSRFGQSPRRQFGDLEASGKAKKTGAYSAKASYDSEVAEHLVKKGRKILPDEDVPRLEKKQKEKVEKVLDKFV